MEQPQAYQYQAASPPPNTPTISNYIQSAAKRVEAAFNQIKSSATSRRLPFKTVRSQENNILYLILQEPNGERYRHAVNNSNLVNRLYDSYTQFFSVPSSTLNSIPEDKPTDSYTQLIKVKGEDQVFLAREGVRHLVSSSAFADFGFSRFKIL